MSTSSEKRLLEAARRCDGATIEEIVAGGKTNLDAVDQIGCTALHLCAKSANLSSLALLLERGARTDVPDKSGMCPLHHAASKDYVETIALLVSYGADINQQNKVNGKTSLHYALKCKSGRSADFLLFCGADILVKSMDGVEAFPVMNHSKRIEHRFIQDGFSKGHISFSGQMIRPNTVYHFKRIELTVTNNDSEKRNMCFFCRRILLDYACNTIKAREEAISDVFQYLVNQPSDNFTVTIPCYNTPGPYDEAFVRDNIGNEYSCSRLHTDSKEVFFRATITLSVENDDQGYFLVIIKTKEERFTTTGKSQVIQSSIEPEFTLEIPDRCLPANTPVVFKSLPTCNYLSQQTCPEIRTASNFCEIGLSVRQRRPLTITLPVPSGTTSDCEIKVYHTDETQSNQTAWSAVGCQRNADGKKVTIMEKSIGRGTAIVIVVAKEKKEGYLQRIRQFISRLYNVVTQRMKPCLFSALTKSSDGVLFQILVILTEESELDKTIEEWRKADYQTNKSQTSSLELMRPSDIYLLKLKGTNITIQGEDMLPMSFQPKRLYKNEFFVNSREYEFTHLLIYKLKGQSQIDLGKLQSEKALFQLNIELRRKQEVGEVHQSFTEFPDSKFLCDLASKIGEEWYLFGVCLGQSSSFLETIQRKNTPQRTNQTASIILYSWRAESDSLPDIGVSTLIHALSKVGRNDLIPMVNNEITKIIKQNPRERVAKWANQLLSGLDDVDAGCTNDPVTDFNALIARETVPSPSSELFLVQVSQIIGPSFDIIPMLGIGNAKLEAMRQNQSPETVMVKCLIECRRKHGEDHIKFLDELLEALTVANNNLAVSQIMELFNQWLKSSAHEKGDNKNQPTDIDAFCAKFKDI